MMAARRRAGNFPGNFSSWKNCRKIPGKFPGPLWKKSWKIFWKISGQCGRVLTGSSTKKATEIFQDLGPAEPPEIFQDFSTGKMFPGPGEISSPGNEEILSAGLWGPQFNRV